MNHHVLFVGNNTLKVLDFHLVKLLQLVVNVGFRQSAGYVLFVEILVVDDISQVMRENITWSLIIYTHLN